MSRLAKASIVALAAVFGTAGDTAAKTPVQEMAATVPSLAPMLERVIPAVVSVRVTGAKLKPVVVDATNNFNTLEQAKVEPFRSGGSGVIFDAAKGLIITNNHVITGAVEIAVGLSDGRVLPARLLGTDVGTDVAVLKVEAKGLTSVKLGNSDALRVGDFIVAVGNPFGLEGSASAGIISATMRTDVGYEIFEDFIQIDAAINPGNSGGALVDTKGRLVGINTAMGSAKQRAQGIGFAIPINMARTIADELVKNGVFKRGVLGIHTEALTADAALKNGLKVAHGILVSAVAPDSSADKAGVKTGDIVVAVSGKAVRASSDYTARVASSPLGARLPVRILSGGKTREVMLAVSDNYCPPQPEKAPDTLASLRGLSLGEILPGFDAFGTLTGARVLTVDGVASTTALLKPDDVITGIDGATVRTPRDVFDMAQSKMGRYRLEIMRGKMPAWIFVDG
jgi:Do/DeqQ family serine protease